jgi:hypothetical protein
MNVAGSRAAARIEANHKRFADEIGLANQHLAAGRLDEAVFHAHLAAAIAAHTHCGVFASTQLERLIHAVSSAIPGDGEVFVRKRSAAEIARVLHVGTELVPVGGLTRMISRWIDADAKRVNSLAVTRQRHAIPAHLLGAVERSGGRVHRLNTEAGSQFDWVKQLRKIGREHDLIVLHIHCEDLIPLIAFANGERFPPVLLLNHADHLFWLGPSVCHAVLSLREAAHDIVVNRRGVATERSLYLPTLVDQPLRRLSRQQARAALNVGNDEVLIISVARGAKYRTVDGIPYASRFVNALKANPKARVVVVGAGMPDDWRPAAEETGGRIAGLPEHPDVATYFEAADIYVDSYPFSSSTSLMEAAGYELPLLTLYTLSHEARLFGINHLGLIGGPITALSTDEWETALGRLIREPDWRREIAANALKAVQCAQPPEWLDWLEAAYQRACELPPVPTPPPAPKIDIDTPRTGEPDWRHEAIYGSPHPISAIALDYMGALPLDARLRVWNAFRKSGDIRGLAASVRLLLPEWLKRRLKY